MKIFARSTMLLALGAAFLLPVFSAADAPQWKDVGAAVKAEAEALKLSAAKMSAPQPGEPVDFIAFSSTGSAYLSNMPLDCLWPFSSGQNAVGMTSVVSTQGEYEGLLQYKGGYPSHCRKDLALPKIDFSSRILVGVMTSFCYVDDITRSVSLDWRSKKVVYEIVLNAHGKDCEIDPWSNYGGEASMNWIALPKLPAGYMLETRFKFVEAK